MLKYFIAFVAPTGNGNTQIDLERPIRSLKDVQYVEKLIRNASDQPVVCVTSWQRFEGQEHVEM
jgi:hypothetical protein